MRLTLIISSLACGGAERVMTIMANYWAARAWDVTVLTMDDGSTAPFYDLDERVCHKALGLAGNSANRAVGLGNNLVRISGLRRAIYKSRPNAVISFMDKTNIVTLLATRGLGIPVIVSEHTDPVNNPIGNGWKQLRKWTYPLADLIVVLSEAALDSFPSHLRPRICSIPNPIMQPATNAQSEIQLIRPSLVAMGRLSQEKGFDLLLRALARLKDTHREWSLTILGEGPLRTDLEALRDELGLSDRVHLPGRLKHPHGALMQGELFVMPSRLEGFPMALCEAMACGLPVICTDCSSGPREIVRHGIDGLLIPTEDVGALAGAMDRLMRDEIERTRMATNARRVTERFGVDRVMEIWREALESVAPKRRFETSAQFGKYMLNGRDLSKGRNDTGLLERVKHTGGAHK